jgi:hypothetical protein
MSPIPNWKWGWSRNLNHEENLPAAKLVIVLPAVQLPEGVTYAFK